MISIFKRILSYFLLLKNKVSKNVLSASFGNKKIYLTSSESLEIQSYAKNKKEQFELELTQIFEKYLGNPDGLFEFLNESGAKIYRISKSDLILEFLSTSQGYIPPQKGFKSLILNIFLNKKISLKTNPVFIFKEGDVSIITLYYEIYKWYWVYKNKDVENVEYEKLSDAQIKSLSFKDTIKMKTAVEDDIGAINFVLNFVKNHQTSKEISNKIQTEGSASI